MSLRFRQLRYFVETVDAGSMNKAAARLHLVPNALSQQIKAIEDGFGLRLLVRHPRGVSLTPAGQRLYADARKILGQVALAEQRLHDDGALPAVYRVGISPSVIHAAGLQTLRATDIRGANVRIEITEGLGKDLSARLEAGDLHYLISTASIPSPAITRIDMLAERLVFAACPTAGDDDRDVTLSAIAMRDDLARFGSASNVWDLMSAEAKKKGFRLDPAITVESTDLLRRLLRRGMASAVLPLGLIEREWRTGEIAVRRIADKDLVRKVAIFWNDQSPTLPDHHVAVLNYAAGLIASYHAATMPFSELIGPAKDLAIPA